MAAEHQIIAASLIAAPLHEVFTSDCGPAQVNMTRAYWLTHQTEYLAL
jgi:hypothetical protein